MLAVLSADSQAEGVKRADIQLLRRLVSDDERDSVSHLLRRVPRKCDSHDALRRATGLTQNVENPTAHRLGLSASWI